MKARDNRQELSCGLSGASDAESAREETIGIIGAMDVEVMALKEAADIEKSTPIAGMEFCEGRLGNKRVVIVQCGMGKVNAGICANILIDHFGCAKIINTGVAGSLDNRIDIGEIIISTDAVQHDFNVEAIGFAKGEIPYTGLVAFPADEALRAAATKAAGETAPDLRVFEGRVCSGDQFITSIAQKEAITAQFGGLCCEMEGAAIAQTCYLHDTPFVILRAVSDKYDGSAAMEFASFAASAAAHCSGIVRKMVESL